MISNYQTQFASAERAEPTSIAGHNRHFAKLELLGQILDSVENGVVILNQYRQIIYANQPMAVFTNLGNKERAIGQRIGEAIGCQHAFATAGGCGTTDFCRSCGAIKAILLAQSGEANTQECRITRDAGDQFDALDLRVKATPLKTNGETLTIFSVTNIADEKRRQVLERIFFHDIRNTATVIHGVAELVKMEIGEAPVSQLLDQASHKLIDEIDAQQQLLAAENGRLELEFTNMLSKSLLEELVGLYETLAADRRCFVQVAPDAENFILLTDRPVLGRVLSNMLKNALEASAPGDRVTAGCRQADGRVYFWVHNPSFMPPNVQRQVFLRSFSTKGSQRGLGTYSMRLLSERFLGGQVNFTTDQIAGTTFTADYPLQPTRPTPAPRPPERETAVSRRRYQFIPLMAVDSPSTD